LNQSRTEHASQPIQKPPGLKDASTAPSDMPAAKEDMSLIWVLFNSTPVKGIFIQRQLYQQDGNHTKKIVLQTISNISHDIICRIDACNLIQKETP
ncbi:MAG: hypothetical protein MUO76_23560, partial [Anaerolineaceae bacterium]|nr:hypothetical protein [Anaerolineaceae bacterium]